MKRASKGYFFLDIKHLGSMLDVEMGTGKELCTTTFFKT